MSSNARAILLLHDIAVTPTCHYCKRASALAEMTADHKTPVCRGGATTVMNLVWACRSCNKLKGPLTDKEFAVLRVNEAVLKSVRDCISRLLHQSSALRQR